MFLMIPEIWHKIFEWKLWGYRIYTFKCFYVVGDTKSGPSRGKTKIWRVQIALYLVGRLRPNPQMELMTKGMSKRAIKSLFVSAKHNSVNPGVKFRTVYLWLSTFMLIWLRDVRCSVFVDSLGQIWWVRWRGASPRNYVISAVGLKFTTWSP